MGWRCTVAAGASCGGTMGGTPELSLELASMAIFLRGLVLHGLRSTSFSHRAPDGGDKWQKGV
jgi:hypothetical protein